MAFLKTALVKEMNLLTKLDQLQLGWSGRETAAEDRNTKMRASDEKR